MLIICLLSLSSKAGSARITINGRLALETDPYQESFRGLQTKLVVMNNRPEASRPMHGEVTDINIWNRTLSLQVRLFIRKYLLNKSWTCLVLWSYLRTEGTPPTYHPKKATFTPNSFFSLEFLGKSPYFPLPPSAFCILSATC